MRAVDLDWLAYLAAAVPPRDIVRAVTARTRRMLSQGVRRRLLAADADTGLGKSEVTAEVIDDPGLRGPRPALLDTSPGARARTVALLRSRWPAACAAVVAEAEAARAGRLTLFGRVVDCSKELMADSSQLTADSKSLERGGAAPLDFGRDPLAPGVRYDPRQRGEEVDLFQPGADAKAPWEVGRLSHLWRYGQARWLAQDAAARAGWARAFVSTVRQFRADCPAGYGVQWACAMEVSARAMHVALSWAYVEDDPSAAAGRAEVLALLGEHGRYIETHLEDTGAVRTNHYAADLVGLVVIGALFPELPEAARFRGWAARALWAEIGRQVRPDGTHFESSTGYQRLCAELFAAAFLCARAAGLPVPRETGAQIASLFRSAGELLKPAGDLPQLGDLDSCRGLPLATRPALSCAYLPGLGAAIFRDGALKSEHEPCPVEVAWLLGEAGVVVHDALPARAFRGSLALRDAGIAVLRRGQGYLCLAASPNGQGGYGGHAHNDKNGVEVSWGGLDLVVDRGTYVYARDPAQRDARRSTAGHSTVQVDGSEQNRMLPGRLFALPDEAQARLLRLARRGGVQTATGEHRGYERLDPGVRHRRTAALLADERAFAVVDELTGAGEHVLEQRWYLPHTDVRRRAATAHERERLERVWARADAPAPFDPSRCLVVHARGAEAALFAFSAPGVTELSLEATDVSPGYNELLPAVRATLRYAGELPARLGCAILVLAG